MGKSNAVVSAPQSGVIHYHKDTEELANQLTKEAVYDTSKGKARFKMRSQSNGKLLFYHLETKKNIYFTKQEWVDGKNSPKNIDTEYMEKAYVKSVESVKEAVQGLISGKSRLMDISGGKDPFNGQEALYGGVTTNGIKAKYIDGGKCVVYFQPNEFAKRFKVIEVGTLTAKEIADRAKPTVVAAKKKSKKKR